MRSIGSRVPMKPLPEGRKDQTMLRVASVLIASTVLLGGVAQAAQGGYYATKADEKAGRLTPGRPAAAPRADAPNAGGEDCGSATAIAPPPIADRRRTHR